MEETKKMVISYDNLVVRLWLNGAVMPFADLLGGEVDTMISESGLPPIPHQYWVDRLGFQQPDPVTDFRSGGVLSLAMMVHMVESCLPTVKRFHPGGDAEVLPFGITCINVTDMMAKFLMLAKSVDRMETLMSQKPFWRLFGDPNAILAIHEVSINMLCDVVVEMNRERKIPDKRSKKNNESMPGGGADEASDNRPVTVFDFSQILERTERRVRDDLLGAGPKTVDELRSIAGRLRLKYMQQLEAKERRAGQLPPDVGKVAEKAVATAGSAVAGAGNLAAEMFEKMRATKISAPIFTSPLSAKLSEEKASPTEPAPTIVELPPEPTTPATPPPGTTADLLGMNGDDDWTGVTKADAVYPSPAPSSSQFSIDDDDDDV
jgi:hypothetical protein